MLPLLLACLSAPTDAPPTAEGPAAAAPNAAAVDDIDRLLAIAAGCALRDHEGLGEAGGPLLWDYIVTLAPAEAGRWTVTFTEEAPATAPYGRALVVDPATGGCGATSPTPKPLKATDAGSASALLSQAWTCASEMESVGGSPLLREGGELSVDLQGRPRPPVASFPERTPTTGPSGLDLVVTPRGGCQRAPMD